MAYLTEPQVYELLKKHGLPVPNYKVFKREESPSWSSFPAYLKVVSERIVHKSEVGGVVRVKDERELEERLKEFREKFKEVEEFILVEELSGIEGYCGVKRDSSFSHLVAVGSGGIFLELFKDFVFIPVSASKEETLNKLKESKLYTLVNGFRGFRGNLNLLLEFLELLKELTRKEPELEELDLNPLFISESRVVPADGRAFTSPLPKRREFRPLEPSLLKPKSVAVIGASQNPEKVGYALVRNLESFKGKVFPVNPKYRELLGFKCYSSVKEIPEEVDCALVAVPARSVPQVVRECGEKGVKLVVVISAGFREVGNKELEREVVEIARRFGVRLLGPNTLGFIVPGISLNASFSSITPPEGEIAFLSQSGALITAVIDASVEERIGFSLVASLGNQADVELTELFWVAVREPETKVVLSYVEGVELGKELLELVNKKPSVFIKVGRGKGGKRAAASHTGSLARDYKLFKDAVEAKGGIVVDSISEAFDCCELLRAYGRIRGKGLVIVTNAGGPGALCADYAEELGLELVDISPIEKELSLFLPDNWSRINPIDLIGDATSKRYRDAFNVLVKFKEWHSCVVVVTPQAMTDVPRIAQEIVRFKELSQRAVVAVLMGGHSVKLGREILKGAGVPTYDEPLRALKAIRRGVWSGQS